MKTTAKKIIGGEKVIITAEDGDEIRFKGLCIHFDNRDGSVHIYRSTALAFSHKMVLEPLDSNGGGIAARLEKKNS